MLCSFLKRHVPVNKCVGTSLILKPNFHAANSFQSESISNKYDLFEIDGFNNSSFVAQTRCRSLPASRWSSLYIEAPFKYRYGWRASFLLTTLYVTRPKATLHHPFTRMIERSRSWDCEKNHSPFQKCNGKRLSSAHLKPWMYAVPNPSLPLRSSGITALHINQKDLYNTSVPSGEPSSMSTMEILVVIQTLFLVSGLHCLFHYK